MVHSGFEPLFFSLWGKRTSRSANAPLVWHRWRELNSHCRDWKSRVLILVRRHLYWSRHVELHVNHPALNFGGWSWSRTKFPLGDTVLQTAEVASASHHPWPVHLLDFPSCGSHQPLLAGRSRYLFFYNLVGEDGLKPSTSAPPWAALLHLSYSPIGGMYEIWTRDLLRDRQAH